MNLLLLALITTEIFKNTILFARLIKLKTVISKTTINSEMGSLLRLY